MGVGFYCHLISFLSLKSSNKQHKLQIVWIKFTWFWQKTIWKSKSPLVRERLVFDVWLHKGDAPLSNNLLQMFQLVIIFLGSDLAEELCFLYSWIFCWLEYKEGGGLPYWWFCFLMYDFFLLNMSSKKSYLRSAKFIWREP